jgi:hypothetical protein
MLVMGQILLEDRHQLNRTTFLFLSEIDNNNNPKKPRILTLIQLDRIAQPSANTSGGSPHSLTLYSIFPHSLLVKRYEVCKPSERVSAK